MLSFDLPTRRHGAHAIGLPTGPGFRSLHHVFQSFIDDDELLTVRETLDLAFARILEYLLAHPDKNTLYYSAAVGGSKIGLGIGVLYEEDVIDYASAILVKVPEMVKEMRKAKLPWAIRGRCAGRGHREEDGREIFVGEQAAMLSDTVPPLVYKYMHPALLELPKGLALRSRILGWHLKPRMFMRPQRMYNKYLDDTTTLPREWGSAEPSLDPEGYVRLVDYKRCVLIFWSTHGASSAVRADRKLDGTRLYDLELVNLIELAYGEYEALPSPSSYSSRT